MLYLGMENKGKETEELNGSMEKLNIEESSSTSFKKKPVIIIVVGMAGNFVQFRSVCSIHYIDMVVCLIHSWFHFREEICFCATIWS